MNADARFLRESEKSPAKSEDPRDTVGDETTPIRSLDQCAEQLGISRDAVRRIEQSFFRKVWRGMKAIEASLEHAA